MALRKLKRPLKRVVSATTRKKADAEQDDDALIGAKETRRLVHNCSEMHIWRLLNVEAYATLLFPRPIKINSRNYWRRRAILDWIELQEERAAA